MCGESVYGRMKDFYGQYAFYHGGAINGFMSDVYYFPKLDISIGRCLWPNLGTISGANFRRVTKPYCTTLKYP